MKRVVSLDLEAKPYANPAQVRIQLSGNPCRVPTCGYLAGDAYICPSCVEEWEAHLGNVAALVEDLELAQRGRPRPDLAIPLDKDDRILFADPKEPVPAEDWTVGPGVVEYQKWAARVSVDNRRASYWLDRLHNELVGQVRLICDVTHLRFPVSTGTIPLSRWLLCQASRIAYLPEQDGWGLIHDLDQTYKDCVNTIDAPTRRKYVKVCDCGLSVWATRETVRCACGKVYDVEAEHEARMDIARDSWVTIREAANAGAAKEDTIKKWIKRAKLDVRGTDPQRVRYGDVLDRAAAVKVRDKETA